MLGFKPGLTKGDEGGDVVGFRPRTCVRALSQDGGMWPSHPFHLDPPSKAPNLQSLPWSLAKMSDGAGHCLEVVGLPS